MKDVLVTPGRHGKGGEKARKTQNTNDPEALDDLPTKESIRRRWPKGGWGWSFGDHLNPLVCWLKKQVGRPLSKVYSEFCEHTDARSLRGWHARDHFWMEVQTYAEYQAALEHRWRRVADFYEDENGILRKSVDNRYRYRKPDPDPDKCYIGDRRFERINNCWFEVWYEKEERSRTEWNFLLGQKQRVYYNEEVKVRQRQLSKKELRDLGLKNDADFQWWAA